MSYLQNGTGVSPAPGTSDAVASWLQGYDNARVALSDAELSSVTTETPDAVLAQGRQAMDDARMLVASLSTTVVEGAADTMLSQAALAIDTARLFDDAQDRRAWVPLSALVAGVPEIMFGGDGSVLVAREAF